jgi:hypothetical protein
MSNFIESLNFSSSDDNSNAIEIKKWNDVNHYETLCQYCANNDIDLTDVSDDDFYAASELMADHGQADKSTDSYFFWID